MLNFSIAWIATLIIFVTLALLMYGTDRLWTWLSIAAFVIVTAAALTRILDRIICGD